MPNQRTEQFPATGNTELLTQGAWVEEHRGSGGRLVSVEGKVLPLKSVALSGSAEGGLARVLLAQVFENPFAEPLRVTYTVPLPADGAVSAYEIRIGERTIHGEIDRRAAARETFERAMLEGRSAGLLEQERSSLFTLQIGNVPPGVRVETRLTVDQRLAWLDDGQWEWRFPTVVAPRYLGEEGRVRDAAEVAVDVAAKPVPIRATLDFCIADSLTGGGRPSSPSHSIEVLTGGPDAGREGAASASSASGGGGREQTAYESSMAGEGDQAGGIGRADADRKIVRVGLTGDGVSLDRDIVVRWGVAQQDPGLSVSVARPAAGTPHAASAYGLLTIVPPFLVAEAVPRDLIVLIDTSGSMSGAPIHRAKKVVKGLVESLDAADRLEMTAFANQPRSWRSGPVAASPEACRDALQWLAALHAGGGTEMTSAIESALTPLRNDAQRQVILVTDGEIGFESEVVRALRDRLPPGSRLHAVGVGSAVNRSLTRPAARAGRGVEVIIGLDEDLIRCIERVVAATRAPAVVDLKVEGSAVVGHAPARLPDLLAGAPVLAGIKLAAAGGEIVVRGRSASGPWEQRIVVAPAGCGTGNPAVIALYGREAVEDLELDLAAGGRNATIDRAVERIGLDFRISTRMTSWVAVSEEKTVDPGQPTRVERIPQELPYGMSAEGLGLGREGICAEMDFSAYMVREAGPRPEQVLRFRSPVIEFESASKQPPVSDFEVLGETFEPPAFLRDPGAEEPVPKSEELASKPEEMISKSEEQPIPETLELTGRWNPVAQIILEFVLRAEGLRTWAPPEEVLVRFASGRRKKLRVRKAGSTGPCTPVPNLLFRLLLDVNPAELRDIETVEFVSGNQLLILRLGETL